MLIQIGYFKDLLIGLPYEIFNIINTNFTI